MFYENPRWKGKDLTATWHFSKELESISKTLDFALYVLKHGQHVLVSKKQNKYNVFYPYQNKYLCMSYAETPDELILIHIKPTTKCPVKRK